MEYENTNEPATSPQSQETNPIIIVKFILAAAYVAVRN